MLKLYCLHRSENWVPVPHSFRKRNCSLCEREYSTDNLPGRVSYRTILQWKLEHEVPNIQNLTSKHKSFTKLYDVSYLCVFCTQFFNYQFGKFVDIDKLEKSVSAHSRPESQDVDVKYSTAKIDSAFTRPISRMNQRITKDKLQLKSKATLPSVSSSHLLRNQIEGVCVIIILSIDRLLDLLEPPRHQEM